MNQYIKTARKDLEQYFAAKKELDQQKASGVLDNLHYMIKTNHLRQKLDDHNPVSTRCLALAESFGPYRLLNVEDHSYLERLGQHEWEKARQWCETWKNDNVPTIAMGVMTIMENIVFPPLPNANPDVVKTRMKAAGYPEETIQVTLDSFLGHLKKD